MAKKKYDFKSQVSSVPKNVFKRGHDRRMKLRMDAPYGGSEVATNTWNI